MKVKRILERLKSKLFSVSKCVLFLSVHSKMNKKPISINQVFSDIFIEFEEVLNSESCCYSLFHTVMDIS